MKRTKSSYKFKSKIILEHEKVRKEPQNQVMNKVEQSNKSEGLNLKLDFFEKEPSEATKWLVKRHTSSLIKAILSDLD